MTPPRWQVTYPNTWRDNLIIGTLMPVVLALLGLAVAAGLANLFWRDRK